MTEETKRTDIVAALERAAARHDVPENTRSTVTARALAADAALLRSLAAACKAYREARGPHPDSSLSLTFEEADRYFDAQRALLALARGETPNHTEHPTDD